MTNKKRVLTSLRHSQPDKIPYNIEFTSDARNNMARYLNDPNFQEKLNNAFAMISLRRKVGYRQVAENIWEDEFGVRYDCSENVDIGTICNQQVSPETLDEYVFPDPDNPLRYEGLGEFINANKNQFVVINHGFSLFERAWTLRGMENILMDMMANPKFVHELLDRQLAFNLRIIERFCSYDIDAMLFGDDWGQQRGLLMGPKLWREFIKPRITQMYRLAKAKGKFVMIHSCGKVQELFPELIEAGLDVFNPFQPEVMDVYAAKQQFGNELSFYGGISTQKTLPYGTPAQVKDEVRRLLDKIGESGGYIAAPAHGIPGDAKPENINAMIEVLQNQ
ncbi:MAG: hypothetical protein HQ546_01895 [Planctomycetes bacterium]|nr:hypothetical protein [Planctomycetota bacterium]